MRIHVSVQPRIAQSPRPRNPLPCLLAILLGFLLSIASLHATAQQPVTKAESPQTSLHKTAHAHKRPSAATQTTQSHKTPPAPAAPAAPKAPDWPVNSKPFEATVVWNRQGLKIDASNSSLEQILKDVATATGTRVEGLGLDQRVFGTYGPGPARDVLAQLLVGSGYNVLMIGDQGQGTPRQIVLSSQQKGDAAPGQAANDGQTASNDDSDADEQPQPPTPPPAIRNGFAPGAPPRTPQQIMQEMQQRQQQQQQNNPPQ